MLTYKYLIAVFADLVDIEYEPKPGWSPAMIIEAQRPSYLKSLPFPLWAKMRPLTIKSAKLRTEEASTGVWNIPYSLSGRGRLLVTVVRGYNIPHKSALPLLFGINAAVELQVWDQIKSTSAVFGSDPTWNEKFELNPYVYDGKFADVLFVRVVYRRLRFLTFLENYGITTFKQELGYGHVPLHDLMNTGEHTIRLEEGGAYITFRIDEFNTNVITH